MLVLPQPVRTRSRDSRYLSERIHLQRVRNQLLPDMSRLPACLPAGGRAVTSRTASASRSGLRGCAVVAVVLATVGDAGCGSARYLQLTYTSTDVMLGTTDTTTLQGSMVERKTVQKDCNLELPGNDVDELIAAFEAIPSASVPADASPGVACTDCQRFDLDATLTDARAGDVQLISHWLKQPSESAAGHAFIDFVAQLEDMRTRAQAQGTCAAPPI